jgi:hypothetical protein
MSTGRHSNGRFGVGNPGGPGRPPAKAEEYLQRLQAAVTPSKFRRLAGVIFDRALAGEYSFAKLLVTYLLPRPPERLEFDDVSSDCGEFRFAGKSRPEIAAMIARAVEIDLPSAREPPAAQQTEQVEQTEQTEQVEQTAPAPPPSGPPPKTYPLPPPRPTPEPPPDAADEPRPFSVFPVPTSLYIGKKTP